MLRVVIFTGAADGDVARLIERLQNEVPEARVAGVLCERRRGKGALTRLRRLAGNLADPDYLPYVARRLTGGIGDRVLRLALRWLHAAPPPEAEVELRTRCAVAGVPLHTTADLHHRDAVEFVRELVPDLGVVYGTGILREDLFALPARGSINIHKREVPDYRGGGPVALWELLDGKEHIGVTVHELTTKLDAGRVVRSARIPIQPYDTLVSLAAKAHVVGNDLIVQSVRDYACGAVTLTPQRGPGRAFRAPPPWKRARYERELALRRPPFAPVATRTRPRLAAKAALALPALLARNWTSRATGRFPVTVLFHHLVTDRPHRLGIATDLFLRHVAYLQEHYQLVSLSTAAELLRRGRVGRPTVALTFDDGYADNFLTLRAVAEKTRVPMALLVSTSHLTTGAPFAHDERPGFAPLSWEQVLQLRDEGFEIGAHTRTHFDCGSTDASRLVAEIAGSKDDLEAKLGEPVRFFSFPFGLPENVSAEAMQIARATYPHVLTAWGGANFGGDTSHLKRWCHPNDLWELELVLQSVLEVEREAPAVAPPRATRPSRAA